MNIHIPESCQEKLNEYSAETGGNYCDSCQTVVIDFSRMSDAEIVDFLRQNPLVKCGKFKASQLQRPLVENPVRRFPLRAPAWAASVAAILLSLTPAQAAGLKPLQGKHTEFRIMNPIPGEIIITGMVKNESTELPLKGVRVMLVGTRFSVTTDANGQFEFSIPENEVGDSLQLHFEKDKFEEMSVEVSRQNFSDCLIFGLKAEAKIPKYKHRKYDRLLGNDQVVGRLYFR